MEPAKTSVLTFQIEIPREMSQFQLPRGVDERLQDLLDRQDRGEPLSASERSEAEGLVDLSEMLSLLRLRARRIGSPEA